MGKFQSNALWPEGVHSSNYGDNISTGTHYSVGAAETVCQRLVAEGFRGQKEHFPIMTWVSPVQQPPKLPEIK